MLNAVESILGKAEYLVDELLVKELSRIDSLCQEFKVYCESGEAVYTTYNTYTERGKVTDLDIYETRCKFFCDQQGYGWEGSRSKSMRLNNIYNDVYRMEEDLRMMNSELLRGEFKTKFKNANINKLRGAIAKRLTKDMKCSDVNVSSGALGVEITATIDNTRHFQARCVLAGGYIQCLHYRYYTKISS